jgi:hypothetical protein
MRSARGPDRRSRTKDDARRGWNSVWAGDQGREREVASGREPRGRGGCEWREHELGRARRRSPWPRPARPRRPGDPESAGCGPARAPPRGQDSRLAAFLPNSRRMGSDWNTSCSAPLVAEDWIIDRTCARYNDACVVFRPKKMTPEGLTLARALRVPQAPRGAPSRPPQRISHAGICSIPWKTSRSSLPTPLRTSATARSASPMPPRHAHPPLQPAPLPATTPPSNRLRARLLGLSATTSRPSSPSDSTRYPWPSPPVRPRRDRR